MASKRVVITVDGPAGSGKTSISKALAKRLGYKYFSSGLFYRAVGFLALKYAVATDDASALVQMLSEHKIQLASTESGGNSLEIDSQTCGAQLFTPEVSQATSECSRWAEVRNFLYEAQRQVFAGANIVAEGRDMGTVIFPEANFKFFIEADVNVRVARRMQQILAGKAAVSEPERNALKKQMEIEIIERDQRDINRNVAPTVPAQDAIVINNTDQTLTQVVQTMYDSVANRGLV